MGNWSSELMLMCGLGIWQNSAFVGVCFCFCFFGYILGVFLVKCLEFSIFSWASVDCVYGGWYIIFPFSWTVILWCTSESTNHKCLMFADILRDAHTLLYILRQIGLSLINVYFLFRFLIPNIPETWTPFPLSWYD